MAAVRKKRHTSGKVATGTLHFQPWLKVKRMRIGELAKRAGVATSKIRFYEAKGLLPAAARLPNGYRNYSDHDLEVVKFIGLAQSLGFTLRDVSIHLRSPQDDARKARLQARLEEKLAELDIYLQQVSARRALILGLIGEVQGARTNTAKIAGLDGGDLRERSARPPPR